MLLPQSIDSLLSFTGATQDRWQSETSNSNFVSPNAVHRHCLCPQNPIMHLKYIIYFKNREI